MRSKMQMRWAEDFQNDINKMTRSSYGTMDSQMTIIIKFDGHQNVMVVIITANDTDFRKSDKGRMQ